MVFILSVFIDPRNDIYDGLPLAVLAQMGAQQSVAPLYDGYTLYTVYTGHWWLLIAL